MPWSIDVHDRRELGDVAHEREVEERLVAVVEVRDVQRLGEVVGLRAHRRHHALDLVLERRRHGRQQPAQAEAVALAHVEARALVEERVVEQVEARRRDLEPLAQVVRQARRARALLREHGLLLLVGEERRLVQHLVAARARALVVDLGAEPPRRERRARAV